jgi:hypothetical protein
MKMIYLLGIIVLGISYCANTVSIKTEIKKNSIAKTDEIKLTVTKNTDALSGAVSGLSLVNGEVKVELVCDEVTTAIAADANAGSITCKPKEEMKTAGNYVLTATGAKIGEKDITVDSNSAKVVISSEEKENDKDSSSFIKLSILILLISLLF